MAARIETFQFSKKFKKEYRKLPVNVQKVFNDKLVLLQNNLSHPSLRIKRIQGTINRWEGSVTMKYRFTFEMQNQTIVFRTIGTHDILNKS